MPDFAKHQESNVSALTSDHQHLVAALRNVHSKEHLANHPHFQAHEQQIAQRLSSYELFAPHTETSFRPNDRLRIVAWNIERGIALEGILHTLAHDPEISRGDVFLLTEVDQGMARSRNRHVARDLAERLNLYGVFAPAFLNLDKGNGAEKSIQGANTASLQGHAILSRYPIDNVELVSIPNGKDLLAGKERQVGKEKAILATIRTSSTPVHCAVVHLSAHSSRQHRVSQMQLVLDALLKREGPTLIGGDWNTSTYNSHRTDRAILGFLRRLFIGVHSTLANHYPYPERYFERKLFQLLLNHDFHIEKFNVPGVCTLHHDFKSPYVRKTLNDWVPRWCFPFIDRALKSRDGLCSFKLDWFAGRDMKAVKAFVVQDLPRGEARYSDHDPIVTDVEPLTVFHAS